MTVLDAVRTASRSNLAPLSAVRGLLGGSRAAQDAAIVAAVRGGSITVAAIEGRDETAANIAAALVWGNHRIGYLMEVR